MTLTKEAAVSSSELPFSRKVWKARNWSRGMERDALDVLCQRIVLGEHVGRRLTNDAGYRRGLGEALLLHQELQCAITASARRNLERAVLLALRVEHRLDVEALQEPASGDVLDQLLDREPSFHAPDVRLAGRKFVEGNVA